MAKQLQSPDKILPMRMRLQIPEDTNIHFSVLDFPFGKAMNRFLTSLRNIHKQKTGENLPPYMYPPDRLLNDGFMALSPSLIQAFEGHWDWEKKRMVAFTHYDEDGKAEDVPTIGQIRSFIRHWLNDWNNSFDFETMLDGEVKQAWDELMAAVKGNAETEWEPGIHPLKLAKNLDDKNALAYIALPAFFAALLHEQEMLVDTQQGKLRIQWRKANDGGSNGLHLLSQPIRYKEDYFAYRLEFSVQNQASAKGKSEARIFANLGIQRYIQQQFRDDKMQKRSLSVLVAFNKAGFRGWDKDSSLIRLPFKKQHGAYVWADGLGELLNSFQVHNLPAPGEILSQPQKFGNYNLLPDFERDEYYLVYAEGRKFGDEKGRQHQVKTGTSLRERSEIMRGVLNLLNGFLEVSPPLQKDAQANPAKSFAMRDFEYMLAERDDNSKQIAAWSNALKTSLDSTGHSHLHLIVLYRGTEFLEKVRPEIESAIPNLIFGGQPLIKVEYVSLPSTYYAPLDADELNPLHWWNVKERPNGFLENWYAQMRKSYGEKRKEWQGFLQGLNWDSSARRLMLIDSTGEVKLDDENKIPPDQKIKGAVRDACHREGILSQFIVGDRLKMEERVTKPRYGKLNDASRSILLNALFDLLLRQQGILFAPPSEIYEKLALLPKEYAQSLDIIAFCRLQKTNPKFHYALAVRLGANGQVHVAFPGDSKNWIPYTEAAAKLGKLFSDGRAALRTDNAESPLRLKPAEMVNFVHNVLTQNLERPTIAVIEAEVWRNGKNAIPDNRGWTQLSNDELGNKLDTLDFGQQRQYFREGLPCLLGVVRLRMDNETPHYISTDDWSSDEKMRDIPQLTGYLDTVLTNPMHYFSVARLPEMQKKQKEKPWVERFKTDLSKEDEIAYKHAQLVEMLPFFVHPDFQSLEGQKQLLRAIHFLRISPAFTSGNILSPYPMHLGDTLIDDQLCIINADD